MAPWAPAPGCARPDRRGARYAAGPADRRALDPRTPVLVGVGQVTERPTPTAPGADRPSEPVELMARALRAAAATAPVPVAGDRCSPGPSRLRVMVPLSWRYVNPGLLVSERLGISPRELALTAIGGNSPQTVVKRHGLGRSPRASSTSPWSPGPSASTPGWPPGATRTGRSCPGPPSADDTARTGPRSGPTGRPSPRSRRRRGLDRPLRVYPLFENALRAAAGETIDEHQRQVVRALGPLLGGGGHQPLRLVARGPHADARSVTVDRPTGWSRSRTRSS